MANFARSVGVVHNPAAACSGYTCHGAGRANPSRLCAREARAAIGSDSGCSNVLPVICNGASTVERMNSANGVPVRSVSASCISVTPPPEYL